MSEKRVVGIRGLDLNLYEQIQDLAKQQKKNVADVINTALRSLLANTEGSGFKTPEIVSSQERFEITAEALIELNPLRVEDIDKLIIIDETNQITPELLKENLDSIVRCTEVYVPSNLYYSVLKKTKNVGRIHKYEKPWKEEKSLRFNSDTIINTDFLERFKKQNSKIRILANGNLYLDPKIPQELFEEIVISIKCNANLAVSENLFPTVLTIGTVEGSVQLIDLEGKSIEQIQFASSESSDRSTRRKRRSSNRRSSGQNPFHYVFGPALDGLFESLEELKDMKNIKKYISEGLHEAIEKVDLDEDIKINVDLKENENKKSKTKRKRVHPTKSKKFASVKATKIGIDDDDNEIDV